MKYNIIRLYRIYSKNISNVWIHKIYDGCNFRSKVRLGSIDVGLFHFSFFQSVNLIFKDWFKRTFLD